MSFTLFGSQNLYRNVCMVFHVVDIHDAEDEALFTHGLSIDFSGSAFQCVCVFFCNNGSCFITTSDFNILVCVSLCVVISSVPYANEEVVITYIRIYNIRVKRRPSSNGA